MPVRDGHAFAARCIESLVAHARDAEIIVVDNGSGPETQAYLAGLRGVTVIRNDINLGWPIACNQGMARARGEFVVLLNSDTEVSAGWLPRLLAPFREGQVALVGPMSDNVSGGQRVDVEHDWRETAEALAFDRRGQSRYVERLVGFCLAIRRRVVDKLGGLDPRYGMGNWDDDDYCLRAQLAGWKLRVAEDCFVHHVGHATFAAEGRDLGQALLDNRKVFLHKWRLLGVEGNSIAEMATGHVPLKDLVVPLPDPAKAHPTVSLCMIVKDEAEFLADCLASVAVDEICIVDTGSSDRTIEIAEAHGARVERMVWDDDFAAARNRSLDMATGDWILVLDADERLAPESVAEVRWLSWAPLPFGAICQIESQQSSGLCVSPVVRFFRGDIGVRYEGALHEQPLVPGQETAVDMSGIRIRHLGYEAGVVAARGKLERNLRIARKMADKSPHFHSVFNLCRAHWDLADYAEAERYAGQAKDLAAMPADTIHAATMEIAAAASRDVAHALALALELRERFSGVPRVVFMVGKILAHMGRHAEAMEALGWRGNKNLEIYLSSNFNPADLAAPGTGLREACDIYTRCAIRLGRARDAVDYLQAAIAVVPRPDPELYVKLTSLLVAGQAWQEAGEVLNRALRLDPNNQGAWRLMERICDHVGRADLAESARRNCALLAS